MHAYQESQTFKGFQFGVEVTYPNFIMLIDVFKSADGHSIFSFCLEKSFQYFYMIHDLSHFEPAFTV